MPKVVLSLLRLLASGFLYYTYAMAKQTLKKSGKKNTIKSTKVDFEPNKMGLAVAILASVSLVLLALIAVQ